MNPDATPIVEFRSAEISNGEVTVVEDLDLVIFPGEFVYLTGRVGSGKTSIIRTITGENPLFAGEGRVAGFDFLGDINTHWHTFGYSVGMMDEFYRLKPGETVENVLRYNSAAVVLSDLGSEYADAYAAATNNLQAALADCTSASGIAYVYGAS